MKYSILFLALIFSVSGFGQLQGVVLDKETSSPVAYTNIWIENEDIGTTSNIDGTFEFKENYASKNLILSAIGYESLSVPIDSSYLRIRLIPKAYQISEATVNPNQKKKELAITHLENIKTGTAPGNPRIIARYFPYKDEYEITPFIKSIKLKTRSLKIESYFNLRFLSVNENGEPGDDILNENIIVKAKRGIKKTNITNFNNTTIVIPENGLFIAIEYLIIEKNAVELKAKDDITNKKVTVTAYMPFFGAQKNEKNENGWEYYQGKWHNNQFGKIKPDDNNYSIAMDVILSN